MDRAKFTRVLLVQSAQFSKPTRPKFWKLFIENCFGSHRKASARSEARDNESLSISRKALRNSNWANAIAIMATVIAVIAIWIAWAQKK